MPSTSRRWTRGARGRTVSARAAFYAAVVMLGVGLAGGLLARSAATVRAPRRSDRRSARRDATRTAFASGAALGARPVATATCRSSSSIAPGIRCSTIPANRPWTPRFSPDGRRVAYGAFGEGRATSDLWVTDLDAGTTQATHRRRRRQPTIRSGAPTARRIAYSASAPGGKDVDGAIGRRRGTHARSRRATATQFPSDWLRDGSALLVTEEAGPQRLRHPRAASRRIAARGRTPRRRRRDGGARLTRRALGRVHVRRVGTARGVSRLVPAAAAARARSRRAAASIPSGAATAGSCTTGSDGALWRCEIGAATGNAPPAIGAHDACCSSAPYPGGSTRCTTCRPTASDSSSSASADRRAAAEVSRWGQTWGLRSSDLTLPS